MTVSPQYVAESGDDALADMAREHLWMHFTRMSTYTQGGHVPVITRGDGAYIWDDQGKKYLDGLAGLFVVQLGHGRSELAEVMAKQASELAFFPIWSYAHPKAIELADRLASLAPGDLNRVFFTSGGGEAVESAWKLAKQFFKMTGSPMKHKVISRSIAYHGTPQGALSITGIPDAKKYFEPLVPSAVKVPNTNFYRAPEHADDVEAFGRWAANRIEEAILFEGPETVAAVFLEPVQNSGGCFPPPPGYLERVREICDQYDVLYVADETICAYGRIGDYFASSRYGVTPDIITSAKGLTSGYAPLGAMIVSDRLFEPFATGHSYFAHGYTWGGPRWPPRSRSPTWTSSSGRASTSTSSRTRAPSGRPWRSCWTCRSWVMSAATGTSTGSSWSRTRPPRRRSTTTSPSGCSAASCPRRCSTRGCTAGPTTGATRSSSWHPR